VDQGIITPIDPELLAYATTGLIEVLSLRATMDDRYDVDKIITFIETLLTKKLLTD
jgi:hypothetical protein